MSHERGLITPDVAELVRIALIATSQSDLILRNGRSSNWTLFRSHDDLNLLIRIPNPYYLGLKSIDNQA